MPQHNVNRDAAPAAVVATVKELGRSIATARTRRRLREEDLASKAGISRSTLRRVEEGELGTGIGAYVAVLWALGLEQQLASVASPEHDIEGQTLEAARRGERVRLGRGLSDDF
ncbi:MAG TPA: helix-turn-helix domain-containing protein [Gemmatimonadaceae bacterium]|nr:helix-turn-helix domain-containing protein [Gemmatimonadaceae bacterium]